MNRLLLKNCIGTIFFMFLKVAVLTKVTLFDERYSKYLNIKLNKIQIFSVLCISSECQDHLAVASKIKHTAFRPMLKCVTEKLTTPQ